MLKFNGKGVYGAIAIGKISVFKRQEAQIRRVHITDTAAELARVDAAKEKAIAQLSEIYEKALKEVGETNAQIFEIHMMMIEDDDYNDSIRNIIEFNVFKKIFIILCNRLIGIYFYIRKLFC